jgi:hypothetical protein
MSANTIVLAQLEVSDCSAELWLNGIPLMRLAPPMMHIQNLAVEQYLIPGTNTLELVIEPGVRPSLARKELREVAFRPMAATGRLIRFPEGVPGTVEYGELLCEARFSWLDATPDRQSFPRSIGAQVNMGPAHGRFSWQDAPTLVLNAVTIDEACALLDELEEAIVALDEERLWRLTGLKLHDVLRSYSQVTEESLRREFKALLGRQQNALTAVLHRDRSKHAFRIVAGGRMLQCIDDDWTSSFKLQNPRTGSLIQYPLFLARIDARLQVIR